MSATYEIYEEAANPTILEAKVNAKLGEHPNCILETWDIVVEGMHIIFSGDLRTVAEDRHGIQRGLFFKCFGDNVYENTHFQYVAWKHSQPNIKVIERKPAVVGETFNAIAVMYRYEV